MILKFRVLWFILLGSSCVCICNEEWMMCGLKVVMVLVSSVSMVCMLMFDVVCLVSVGSL